MCSCGCEGEDEYRLLKTNGATILTQASGGCRDCSNPPAILIYRISKQEAGNIVDDFDIEPKKLAEWPDTQSDSVIFIKDIPGFDSALDDAIEYAIEDLWTDIDTKKRGLACLEGISDKQWVVLQKELKKRVFKRFKENYE